VGGTQADASTAAVSGNAAAVAYAELVAAATQRMGAEEETIPGQEAIKDYVKGQAWNVTTKFVVGTTMHHNRATTATSRRALQLTLALLS